MNADSSVLEAAQAALDDRRDPLSDPALLAALEQEPEAYGDVERLLAGLDRLARVPAAPTLPAASTPSPLVRFAPLAAGAALALGLGLLAASLPERRPDQRGARIVRSTPALGGELLEYHVSIANTTPNGHRVVFNDNGSLTHERSYTGDGRTSFVSGDIEMTIRHRMVAANRR